MRLFLVLLAIACLAACSEKAAEPQKPPEDEAQDDAATDGSAAIGDVADVSGGAKTIEDMRAESLAAIDQQACEAGGGEVRQEGMLGMYRCVTPYADAGAECRSSSDCEGKCLVTDDTLVGEATVGACQADDSPFGCYAEIEDGQVTAALCVD